MAQSDAESLAWDSVQQDAVQRIFGMHHPTCARPLPESALPSLLERRGYELSTDIATEIGRGTYGCVMKVRRVCDGRAFAMKRQTLGLTAASAETVLREIGILNSVRAVEGLVQMEDVFMATTPARTEGSVSSHSAEIWAILEHFPGNLSDAKASFRSEWSTRRVIFQLLRGLQALHEADIVHRDLKPGNVLVDVGSNPPFSIRAVICDFGLSRSVGDVHSEFLETSDAAPITSPRRRRPVSTDVVTAPWRAPELWNWADVGRMSRRDLKSIDVFSLALIWAELLGGSRVIRSEDGRDPPSFRLLEIIRRVDCPDDSVLDELGFVDDVSEFVRSIASEDFAAIRSKLEGSHWPRASSCNQDYAHYLLEEQPYRGIRAWVLRHSPTLSTSSPALALIESASRFDYRRRPSAHELLNDDYFFLLRTKRAKVSKCKSIADVAEVLDNEAHIQTVAYEKGDVDEARTSVGRVAWKIRAEIAASRSKGEDDGPSRQSTSAPVCNASCPVLLGRSSAREPSRSPSSGTLPMRSHTRHSPGCQLGKASPPVQRFWSLPLLQYLACPARKPARGYAKMPQAPRGGA